MGENPVHKPVQNPGDPHGPQAWQPPAPNGQPPGGQQPYPPFGPPALKQETTNTLAIVSFVSSFFVGLAGVITGHLALNQIKRTGEKGRGFALAGVIIGYAAMAATVVAIAAIIVFSLAAGAAFSESIKSMGPQAAASGPATMNAYGGITFGAQGEVIAPAVLPGEADLSELPQSVPDLADIGITASASGEPVQAVVYVDFLCPHCADFEKEHGPMLEELRDQGSITLEYRPVAFLDRLSAGTEYSTRSAQAAACVAGASPEKYPAFLDALFTSQPAMNTQAPDDATLARLALAAGAGDIGSCLTGGDTAGFVADATHLAVDHGVTGTPTVYLDGVQWEEGTFASFADSVLAAKK